MLEIKSCEKEPFYNQLTASNIDALQFYAIITVILKGLLSQNIETVLSCTFQRVYSMNYLYIVDGFMQVCIM